MEDQATLFRNKIISFKKLKKGLESESFDIIVKIFEMMWSMEMEEG